MPADTVVLLGAKSQHHPLDNVPAELSKLKQLFIHANLPLFKLEYEPYLTRSNLGDILLKLTDRIQLLHFAGHSNAEQLDTNSEAVYARHIAGIINTWNEKPNLLFLNGCQNAGQVQVFLEAGIQSIIATYNPISDQQASTFAYQFYANFLKDNTTLDQAFKRAGALTLISEPREPRTLNITNLIQTTDAWDWGLFSNDSAYLTQTTLNTLIQALKPKPLSPLIDPFIANKRTALLERQQRLSKQIAQYQKAYDLNPMLDQKDYYENLIQEKQRDLASVEAELKQLATS